MRDAISILRRDGPIVFLGAGKLAAYEDWWISHAVTVQALGNADHGAVNEHASGNSRRGAHLPTIIAVQAQGHIAGRSPVIKNDIDNLEQLASGTVPGGKSLAVRHGRDPNREQATLACLQRELNGDIIDTGIGNDNDAITRAQAALIRDELTQTR